MVKYLGLDYLSLVKFKRREIIAQACLSAPEMHDDIYLYQSLDKIRSPWKEANVDLIPSLGDSDPWIDRLFCDVALLKQHCLESYGKEGPSVNTASLYEVSSIEDDIQDEDLGYLDEDPYGVFDLTNTMNIEEEFEEPYTEAFMIQKNYSDDFFEEIVIDLDIISSQVPPLRIAVQSLQPLFLQDPFIQREEEEDRCGPFEHGNALPERSPHNSEEHFTPVELFQEDIFMEVPMVTVEELPNPDSCIWNLDQLSPFPSNIVFPCDEEIKIGNGEEDNRPILEKYEVDSKIRETSQISGRHSTETFVVNKESYEETCPTARDWYLETLLLPPVLSAEILIVGELQPISLTNWSNSPSLSPISSHQLIQSDVNFDLCCVERCRFSEPEVERVEYFHMDKLSKEWTEVAVRKWNEWKVELNLPWIINSAPEIRVDLEEAVVEYINNGRQREIEDQEVFYKVSLSESAPLDLSSTVIENLGKLKDLHHFNDPDTDNRPTSLSKHSGLLHSDLNTTNSADKDDCFPQSSFTASRIHLTAPCELNDKSKGDKHQNSIYVESPSHETDGRALIQQSGLIRISPQRISKPVTLVSQSPEGFRTLRSLQDPFMESGDNVAMTKTRLLNNISHRKTKDNPLNQLPQNIQKINKNQQYTNPEQRCSPASLKINKNQQYTDPEQRCSLVSLKINKNQQYTNPEQRCSPASLKINKNQQYTNPEQRCSPASLMEEKESTVSQRVTRDGPSSGLTVGQFDSWSGTDHQTVSNTDPCLDPDVDQSYSTQNDTGVSSDNSHAAKGRKATTKTSQNSPNRRPSKSRIKCISYQLNGEYQKILNLIAHHASYFITSLVNSGDLDKSTTFTSLTSDFTRFVMKEVTSQPGKLQYEDRYRYSLALHTLCCASKMTVLLCLESCLELLSIIQEKYKDHLKGCLETLRKKLFSAKLWCDQERIMHPKIFHVCLSVCKTLAGRNSDNLSHTKILVILNKNLDSLVSTLEQSLQRVDKVKVHVQVTGGCQNVLNNLDHCNCMLLHEDQIGSDFPWSQFCLVVEYEGDHFLDLCQRQNIKYRHFSYTPTPSNTGTSTPEVNMTIVCSSLIPETFVHVLESKYGVTCIYRSQGVWLTLPYIMIDEVTCVVMYDVLEVGMDFSALLSDLSYLAQQFSDVLIIASTHNFNQPQLKLRQHQQKLNFCLGRNFQNVPDLRFKVVTSDSVQMMAEIVARVCHMVLASDDQNWMSVSPSQEEQCLTEIPSINPIFAQKMLQILSLQSITDLHPTQLSRLFCNVPRRIIQMFYKGLKKLKSESNPPEVLVEAGGVAQEIDDPTSLSPPSNMEEEPSTFREGCQKNFPEESVSSWESISNREKDQVTPLSQTSAHSKSANEFVRAQRGLKEENICYLEELRRVVDRQVQEQMADSGTGETCTDDKVTSACNLIDPEVKVKNDTYSTIPYQLQKLYRCNTSDCSSKTHDQYDFIDPEVEVKNDSNSTIPNQMGKKLYNCNTSDCSSKTHDQEGCTLDAFQTSAENNQLESVDFDSSLPTCQDFQDNVVATTRQLLKHAVLSSNDRMFRRAGPRKVSIGLARPLRQTQVAGEPQGSLRLSDYQREVTTPHQRKDSHSRGPNTPSTKSWNGKGLTQSNRCKLTNQNCLSQSVSQSYLPFDCDQENRLAGERVKRWPGYDSPPMDIEYNYYPQQDTDDLQSLDKTSGPINRKLTFQRVPNSKQSQLVFKSF